MKQSARTQEAMNSNLAQDILDSKRIEGKYNVTNKNNIDQTLEEFCNTWPKNKISQFLTNQKSFDNTIKYIQKEYFNSNNDSDLDPTIIRKLLTKAIIYHFSYDNQFSGRWIPLRNTLSINLGDHLKNRYNQIFYDAIFDASLLDSNKNYIDLSMKYLKPSTTKEIHSDNCSRALLNHIDHYSKFKNNKNDISISDNKIYFAKKILEFAKSSNYLVKKSGYENNNHIQPTMQLLDFFQFSPKNFNQTIQDNASYILQNRFLNFVNFNIENNNVHCNKINFHDQKGWIYENCNDLVDNVIKRDHNNITLQMNVAKNIRLNLKDNLEDYAYRGVKLNLSENNTSVDFLNREAQIIIDAENLYKKITNNKTITLDTYQKEHWYIAKIIFTIYENYNSDNNHIKKILDNITDDKERLNILQEILMLTTNQKVTNFDIFANIFQYANFCRSSLSQDYQMIKKDILSKSSNKLDHFSPDKAAVVLPQAFFNVIEQTTKFKKENNNNFDFFIEEFVETNDFLTKFTNDNRVQISYIQYNWFQKIIEFFTQPLKTISSGFKPNDFIIKIGKEQYSLKKLVPHLKSEKLLDIKYRLITQYDESIEKLCKKINSTAKYELFKKNNPEICDVFTPIIIKTQLEKSNINNEYIKHIANNKNIPHIYNLHTNKLNINYLSKIAKIDNELLKLDHNNIKKIPKLYLEDWIITNINRKQISEIPDLKDINVDQELKNIVNFIKNLESQTTTNNEYLPVLEYKLLNFSVEKGLSFKLNNFHDTITIPLSEESMKKLLQNSNCLKAFVQCNDKKYKKKESIFQFFINLFKFKFNRPLINNTSLISYDEQKYNLTNNAILNILNSTRHNIQTKHTNVINIEEQNDHPAFEVNKDEIEFCKNNMKLLYEEILITLLNEVKANSEIPRANIINENENIRNVIEEIKNNKIQPDELIKQYTTEDSKGKAISKILELYKNLDKQDIQDVMNTTQNFFHDIENIKTIDSKDKEYLKNTFSVIKSFYDTDDNFDFNSNRPKANTDIRLTRSKSVSNKPEIKI